MPVEMWTEKLPPNKAQLHGMQMDQLAAQCNGCKSYKPKNKHNGCEIRWKLINQDSEVAWKNKHLFLDKHGKCKMFLEK